MEILMHLMVACVSLGDVCSAVKIKVRIADGWLWI